MTGLQTDKLPYEVLVRFGDGGEVRGAHVIWRYVTRDGCRVVSDAVGSAEPAGQGGSDFPLSDAVGESLAAGIAKAGNRVAEVEAMLTDRDKQIAALAELHHAIADVTEGRAERICVSGEWVVWRDETGVRVEIKA